MKLAFVYASFDHGGGAENYLIAALTALSERGHDVHLFTASYNETYYSPAAQQAFSIDLIGGRGFDEGIGGTWRNIRVLTTCLRGFDRCVAVNFPAHVWVALGMHRLPVIWLCMEPKRNLYPRVLYTEAPGFREHQYRRALDYRGFRGLFRLVTADPHVLLPYWARAALQRGLDQIAARRVQRILALSPYMQAKIAQIYQHPHIDLIWAGVEPPAAAAAPSEPLILIPTRLEPIKQVEVALHATALLGSALGDYRLCIVGTGSDQARLERLALELGLTERVTFTGYISTTERDSYYNRCAFVVYPALAEPFGLPCVEAGRAGKAVIAAHQGGPATIIEPGVTGLLVDMTSPRALADAMRRLMIEVDQREAMGTAARRHIETLMSISAWMDRFETALA